MTGTVVDSNIVTALRVANRADSVQFGIGTDAGNVAYYGLTPASRYDCGGDSLAYTLVCL